MKHAAIPPKKGSKSGFPWNGIWLCESKRIHIIWILISTISAKQICKWIFESSFSWRWHDANSGDTVDGRNPAPARTYKSLKIMGYFPYQLVQDFFHQHYHNESMVVPLGWGPIINPINTWYGACLLGISPFKGFFGGFKQLGALHPKGTTIHPDIWWTMDHWILRSSNFTPPELSFAAKWRSTWNPKQPFINGCFNWMIPNLYIENGCFTKHPFISGCLGFQLWLEKNGFLKKKVPP